MHFRSILSVFIIGCILHQAISDETKKLPFLSSSKQNFLNRTLEYLKVTEADVLYDSVMKMTIDSLGPLLGSYQADLKQFMNKCCSYSAVKHDIAKIYMEEFTLNDINQMIRFYSSPVGKKFTQKQTILMVKAKELGERKAREHLPKFQAMLLEKLSKNTGITQAQ